MKGLIFTYGLAYGGAVVSLFRPWYGLLIYVAFAIIRPEQMWHWQFGDGGGSFSRIVALALLVGWSLRGFGNWNLGRGGATVFALTAYWVWSLISSLTSANQSVAFGFVEELAKILLPFLAAVTLIDSERKLKHLAWVIVLSEGYLALEMNMSYFQGFNQLELYGFGGMDNNCVAIALVTGAGLAFFMGMYVEKWWQKAVVFGSAALMAHAILFSFSRGGMLALVITGVVSFLLIDKRPKHYALLATAAVAAVLMAGPEVRGEFWSTFAEKEQRDESAQSRIDMWWDCLDVMEKNPLLGIGPDHWVLIAHEYGWPRGKEAHTLWLQIGAEVGVVGLGFLLAFYVVTMQRLLPFARRRVRGSTEWEVAVARMYIASFTGFMVSAQFVSLEGLELPYYITILGAGLLKLHSQRVGAQARQSVYASRFAGPYLQPSR